MADAPAEHTTAVIHPVAAVEENAFAAPSDLEARWHALTDEERQRAEALLDDASAIIRDECPRWASASPATLRAIACAMVMRKMTVADDRIGVTGSSQTAVGFSESFNYSNPMGDLYLTSAERRRLGGGARLVSVTMAGGAQ